VFNGPDRWLEIAVRTNGSGGFTNLAPRQPLAPFPMLFMLQQPEAKPILQRRRNFCRLKYRPEKWRPSWDLGIDSSNNLTISYGDP